MQSSSRSRPFKSGLIGASPITDAICSQGVISSARRFAKAEVRGANPRESATLPLCLSKPQDEFCKLVFVGANPTRGSNLRSPSYGLGGHLMVISIPLAEQFRRRPAKPQRVGAIPTRDSIFPSISVGRYTPVFQTGIRGALP